MVGTLIRMRWALQVNELRRSTWIMINTIVTWAGTVLGSLALVIGGLLLSRIEETTIEGLFTGQVIVAALVLILWAIIPIFLTGVDMTLDPARFAMYPISARSLVFAIAGSAVISPSVVTTLALFVGMALMWAPWPMAMVVGLLMAPILALTAVSVGYMLAAWASNVLGKRRSRDIIALIGLVILMFSGVLVNWLTQSVVTSLEDLPALAAILGWTPLGFAIGVPFHGAVGQWLLAAVKLVLALAWLAVIFALWIWGVRHALVNVTSREVSKAKTRGLGPFNFVPQTPTGAVWARSLVYWLRDPRYSGNLLILPVLPLVMYFSTMTIPGEAGFTGMTMPFTLGLMGVVMGVTLMSELSYDNTAFSLHVISGVSGKADRLGRVLALLTVAVPGLILIGVIMSALLNYWHELPASLGIALAGLFGGTGVSSILSTVFIFPTAKPGESPFTSQKSGFTKTFISSIISMVSGLLVMALPIGLYILQLTTENQMFGWLALISGVVLGCIALWIGITVGSRIYQQRLPELYQQVVRL